MRNYFFKCSIWIILSFVGLAHANDEAQLLPIEILLKNKAPHLIPLIEKAGGEAYALDFMPIIVANVPAQEDFFAQLRQDPAVAQIANSIGGREELEISTQAILLQPSSTYPQINNWWQNGYTGSTGVLGVLDSGVAVEHAGFQGKNLNVRKEEGSTYNDYVNGVRTPHGTGVACIMGGTPSTGKGVAFGAKDYLIAMAGDVTSEGDDFHAKLLTLESLDWMLTRSGRWPTVINYSFGHGSAGESESMDWSMTAKVLDYVVNAYDILWVKSAGNSGWIAPHQPGDGEYYLSTLTVPAENYNALTVANINTVIKTDEGKYKTPDRSMHSIRYTSSRGPTRIGRKKPDLAAPGHDTRTCAPDEDVYDVEENPYFGPYSSSEAYDATTQTRLMGGTSAASPHVAGAVLLLQEAGITDPMAVKALLINSADAWTDNKQPSPDDPHHLCDTDEPLCGHKQVAGSHWDRTYGWGYLNMQQAFEQRNHIKMGTLSTQQRHYFYNTVLDKDEKVTLVHERRVGYHPDNQEWQLTPLYLQIFSAQTGVILDADHSRMDTVHQVANPSRKQEVVIWVSLPSDVHTIDGVQEEAFALVSAQPIIVK